MAEERTVIIGGGISGLSTAYYLAKQQIPSVIIEKSRLGGLIRTDVVDGCELEAGPDSFIATKPAVAEIAQELGLGSKLIGSNDEKRRIYLVRGGKLVLFPKGMVLMAPAEWPAVLKSDLFSVRTKLGFLAETFRRPHNRQEDVSLTQFITDHFGVEVLDWIAEPLLSGVYGGDPGSLSAQSVLPRFLEYEKQFGSLIRGVRQERKTKRTGSLFQSFEGGMQTLITALQQAVRNWTEVIESEAYEVAPENNSWRIQTERGSFQTEQAVLACSAYESARLVERAAPALANELNCVPYSSAILVTFLFARSTWKHALDGFGFLVPRSERGCVAAATWVSTKFPSRTPGDRIAIRAFIVGAEAEQLLTSSDVDIVAAALFDLTRLMGIQAGPVKSAVQRWPRSMPQYTVGHQARLGRIQSMLKEIPGLHLVGNAYAGVGIPDCVRLGKETAKQIATNRTLTTMSKT